MRPTLLIADDDQEFTDRVRPFMVRYGYHLETASGGLECLTKLRQVTPDLLILYLNLPWGGGDGILEWVREESGRQPLPTIVLTGHLACADTTHLVTPPVMQYLQKPFSIRDMLRSIRAVHYMKGWQISPFDERSGGTILRSTRQEAHSGACAGVAHPIKTFAFQDTEQRILESQPHALHFLPEAFALGETYSWGAIVHEISAAGISLSLCYPFRLGTYLALDMQSADGAARTLIIRVDEIDDQADGMWRLHGKFVKPVNCDDLPISTLLTQSV